MGFSNHFCNLIKACTHNIKYCLKINGSYSDTFTGYCGLRQGCPLSPYLFILTIDALSRITTKFMSFNIYKPISFNRNSMHISHILYADDCFLFCEASDIQWDNIERILNYLNLWTGLSVNYSKSSITFSRNTSPSLINHLLSKSNLTLMPNSMLYLGNPLFPTKGSLTDFSFLINKIAAKLATWKVVYFLGLVKLS